MPKEFAGISSDFIHTQINLLIQNLVNTTDTTGEFLMTLADGRVIDTKGWNDWEWTHGIGLLGLYKYHSLSTTPSPSSSTPSPSAPDALAIIEAWFKDRFASGGTTKNINTMAAMLTLAYIYEDSPIRNRAYLPYLEAWGDWAMYDLPRTSYGGMQHLTYLTPNRQQLWDDTLMMTVLPLAKIGLVLNRPEYVEEAKRQFLIHITYLFDRETGLWFHGWTFEDGGYNFARARWARGNSWVTMVIPLFLELLDLPRNDSFRMHLTSVLLAQVRALLKYQSPSGAWHTLLDDASPESYLESSATAGFAFGILMALRRRDIVGKEYEEMALKAVKAVLGQIDEKGELQNTSFGTGMGDNLEFYKQIKRTGMPYGQAMGIMALGEFLRRFL